MPSRPGGGAGIGQLGFSKGQVRGFAITQALPFLPRQVGFFLLPRKSYLGLSDQGPRAVDREFVVARIDCKQYVSSFEEPSVGESGRDRDDLAGNLGHQAGPGARRDNALRLDLKLNVPGFDRHRPYQRERYFRGRHHDFGPRADEDVSAHPSECNYRHGQQRFRMPPNPAGKTASVRIPALQRSHILESFRLRDRRC